MKDASDQMGCPIRFLPLSNTGLPGKERVNNQSSERLESKVRYPMGVEQMVLVLPAIPCSAEWKTQESPRRLIICCYVTS